MTNDIAEWLFALAGNFKPVSPMTQALKGKLQYWPQRDATDVLKYAEKVAETDLTTVLDFGCGPGPIAIS